MQVLKIPTMQTGAEVAKRAFQELTDIQVQVIVRMRRDDSENEMRWSVVWVPKCLLCTLSLPTCLSEVTAHVCCVLLFLLSSTVAQSMSGPCWSCEQDIDCRLW